MRKMHVYADTSVFGGTRDEQFAKASTRFFERVAGGEFILLLSRATIDELAAAPEAIREVLNELPPEQVQDVMMTADVEELARQYVSAKVLGEASLTDAIHVAAATVAGADLILSWNFTHIVNFDRIRGFNSVNIRLGYRSMTILSPLEIGRGDEKEGV